MSDRDRPGHDGLVNLRSAGIAVVLDTSGDRLPRVLHWGEDLGDLSPQTLLELRSTARAQVVPGRLDAAVPVSLLPEQSVGWLGTPGVSGHRSGRDFSPAFEVDRVDLSQGDGPVAHRLVVTASDVTAGLSLDLDLEMTVSGLIRMRATLRNDSPTSDYTVDALWPALPLPIEAQEILDFTGRHLRERSPQRHALTLGTHVREGRRGRTGADATLLMVAGTPGFSFSSGKVWGLHVAWSGNHRTHAERCNTGEGLLSGGELLLPGEGTLAPGEAYSTPWVYGSHGTGLDELSSRFHEYLRARPQHPKAPRPVVMNTWEAVYFDQDLDSLIELAEAAAEVGAERFVLDDGWFRGRRDETSGLGDWYVDETVWPQGLGRLVDVVRSLGMQFGLWFEPEMINLDSDLARAHPDWILSPGDRLPPAGRSQQVLDLAEPEAYTYILERLDSLVSEYDIDYIKWDHNRDLVDAGRSSHGRAGVHEQTLAVYRLIDELKARHPLLEIESCSAGGARADLGILERTDRIWASDCIDALERQQIERWTGLLLPPELIGSHVGAPRSHSTGRTHVLPFRAGTALFGHLGIEWDLRLVPSEERAQLARWVALYKDHRDLLHHGRVVRVDHADPALHVHGVVAQDCSEAIFAIVALATSVWTPPGRVLLPGLDFDATYHLRPLTGETPVFGPDRTTPWWNTGAVLPGRVLSHLGVQAPAQLPEHLVLIHATRL